MASKIQLIDNMNVAFLDEQIKAVESDFKRWFNRIIMLSTTQGKTVSGVRKVIRDTPLNTKRFERQVISSVILAGLTTVIEKDKLDREDKERLNPLIALALLYGINNQKLIAKKTQKLVRASLGGTQEGLTVRDKKALVEVKSFMRRNNDFIKQQLDSTQDQVKSIQKQMKSNVSKVIVKNLNAEVRKKVTEKVNGETFTRPQNKKEIQKAMRAKFGNQIEWRVNRILDTELKTLEESSKWGLNKNMGYKTKSWNSQEDRRVRTSHEKVNNTTIPIEKKFILPAVPEERVRGGTAMFPSDPSLPPEQRINCRCFLTYNK